MYQWWKDGYSRKMMWPEAYKTNSDPLIIVGYLIDAVTENSGCPQKVRFDLGTENTHVAEILSHYYEILSHYFKILPHYYEKVSHYYEILSQYIDIVSHYNDLQDLFIFHHTGGNGLPYTKKLQPMKC